MIASTIALASVPATGAGAASAPVAGRVGAGASSSADARAGAGRWRTSADVVFRHLHAVELQYAWSVTQDAAGFLWSGSDSGLARWDGYQTKTYVADASVAGSLPAGQVNVVYADAASGLWVGASVGGIARYEPRHDGFVVLGHGPGGLQDANVLAIASDRHGGLWVGTATGLDHLDPATDTVRHVTGGAEHVGAVNAVAQGADGDLWLATEHGLLHRRGGVGGGGGAGRSGVVDERTAVVATGAGAVGGSAGGDGFRDVPLADRAGRDTPVRTLCLDAAGRLWIGTRANGLLVLEPGQTAARQVRDSDGAAGFDGIRINAIADAGRAGVWVATSGGGVLTVEPEAGWRTRHIRHQPAIASSLLDDDVTALCVDRSGVIWVSTTLGLSAHTVRDGVWTLFGAKSPERPITGVQVPAVLAHPDGRVWLGVGDGGGIDILDPRLGRVGALRPSTVPGRAALPPGRVNALAATRDGTVYLGTTQGLYVADAQGRSAMRVSVPERAADAAVYAVAAVGDEVCFGGRDGVWMVAGGKPDAPHVLRHVPPDRLGNRKVTAIAAGAGGVRWVGTTTGVWRVDTASDAVAAVPEDTADAAAFAGGYVGALLLDDRQRLWVATYGIGIQVMAPAEGALSVGGVVRRIGEREGLTNNTVDALVRDARGRVWASTDNGLLVVDPTTYAVRGLGEPQGVAILQYWAGAGARTASGEILFGGIGGLTVVDPEAVGGKPRPPQVVVTEARVDDRLLSASRFNLPGPAPTLVIQPGGPDLTVEYAVLDFAVPEGNRYSHRLLGHDRDWIATPASRRLAVYTDLSPGDYVLQLRGASAEAPDDPVLRELPVRVLAPWYESVPFRLAMALLALFGIVGVVQLRTARLREREHALQALVAERTADLQASQRQLELIAYADPLTGLPNRRRFNDDVRSLVELALRGTVSLTLLLIDLDRFKHINDTLGHDVGDALLVETASRLSAAVRQGDRLARLGGDEFAVLMPDGEDAKEVDAVCRRIVESLGRPFDHAGGSLQVSASIGAAGCPRHAPNPDALYKCADTALYDAKRAGRDTWRVCGSADASYEDTAPAILV